MKRFLLPVVVIVFLSILFFTTPMSVFAKQDWMKGSLGKYLEKLNDQYLQARMTNEQIEKNTELFLRDYLTIEDLSHLENPKVMELITFPSIYNEKEILFHGEAIGQIMFRGEYCWVNVMDQDGNSLGCWMPSSFANDIQYLGRYKIQGDTLLLKGIYHSAREDHGGETELEVNDIVLLQRGKTLPADKVNTTFVTIIFILGLGILVFMIYQRYFKKNNEQSSGGGMFFGDQN
jgi:hypothetical protein